MNARPILALVGTCLLGACAPAADPGDATTPEAQAAAPDTELGGQLYDKWYRVDDYAGGFSPDDDATEVADGSAGPNGDGTLNNAEGAPLANTGHDYRIKNLFGWDLRGAEGIYGPAYQNKSTVLATNLLTDGRDKAALIKWFTEGDATLPAYGDVMTPAQIESLVTFILAVRDGSLPQPDQIFALSADAPKNYTLVPGADPAAGRALFGQRCAGCHGDGGEAMVIDGKYTLGAFGRMKAYEGWLKVLSGHPGSGMPRQSDDAQEILAIFAALCDRATFPPADAEHEVADGDPRCGAYLR